VSYQIKTGPGPDQDRITGADVTNQ
jgi:hypothetical protein